MEASHYDAGTAYVSFDGHRSDDFNPYVFKTNDFGRTWVDISGNLPDGHSVHVIKEDVKNPELLFVGTEFACFVSVDGGASWARLMGDMPTVAFRDLVIHPRDSDLVAGTHGRSIWILDDVSALQQLNEDVLASEVHLFEPRVATQWLNLSKGRVQPNLKFRGQNPPSDVSICFYLKLTAVEPVEIVISDPFDASRKQVLEVEGLAGINQVRWNMRIGGGEGRGFGRGTAGRGGRRGGARSGGRNATPAGPGDYLVKLTVGETTLTSKIRIRQDPMLNKEN
ncbi:MAG: hypothetical protein GY869_30390 [Planctomycetes bacterium]|nr:hypothetical protein [Planctomycetota bacterium]